MSEDCREEIAQIEDSEVRKDSRLKKEERVNQLNKPIPLNTPAYFRANGTMEAPNLYGLCPRELRLPTFSLKKEQVLK